MIDTHMKQLMFLLLMMIFLLFSAACGEPKVLHCDNCDAEVTVDASSNMEDDWSIYCEACNEELFGDDPVLNGE